ncbi:hypothetical protein Sjap_000673 [Stephania japonica]|uniref:glutathione transferase n=1 Tax=Stephania japonica TaxID=461633 RepID=A0AAP0KII8_9MAGN
MKGDLKLFGAWPSPFMYRVIWALKLKGIHEYEHIEEDLKNKSDLLLKYNPIHKKIPVLVHHGKPICESLVILEYLEEIWPDKYKLLPTDPYERANARFWLKYQEDLGSTFLKVFLPDGGEEQERAVKESLEALKNIENALGDKKFFNGDKVGIVDLAYAWMLWQEMMQEVANVRLVDPQSFPKLWQWMINFKEAPIIKDNLPDRDEAMAHFRLELADLAKQA